MGEPRITAEREPRFVEGIGLDAVLRVVRERAERLERERDEAVWEASKQRGLRLRVEARLGRAAEALRGLRYHKTDCWCLLGDGQHDVACRAVRAVLAEQEKEQP